MRWHWRCVQFVGISGIAGAEKEPQLLWNRAMGKIAQPIPVQSNHVQPFLRTEVVVGVGLACLVKFGSLEIAWQKFSNYNRLKTFLLEELFRASEALGAKP